MKRYGIFFCGLCLTVLSLVSASGEVREIPMSLVSEAFSGEVPPHPRLLITEQAMAEIKGLVGRDELAKGFADAVVEKADRIVKEPPVERVMTGRRLLGVSRKCLDRVIHLAFAYRLTGNRAYLERGEMEMVAASGFSDWNPSHFLDVAEMTSALAIGYDWFYHDLSDEGREAIQSAIRQKGLEPGRGNAGWVRGNNNWNQVCNGGMVLGVLAILEDEPELAKTLVHRAVNGVQVAMEEYEPDGAYPEGPGYWVYGTSFNVMLLAALETVLGTDFGLSEKGGYAASADYYMHVTGPTGDYFNYPDSGRREGFQPAVFWFSRRFGRPELNWHQMRLWRQQNGSSRMVASRLAPLTLAWYTGKTAVPQQHAWMGRGANPVAAFRSSWEDAGAVYFAIKGGSPSCNHGHMDVGSFVLDAQGERWAEDLGPESYNKIEQLGMNLWNNRQDSDRWKIFRYNNLSHNTLVVNGEHQRVSGYAPIVDFSAEGKRVVIDMAKVYAGQLSSAIREASMLEDGRVVIQDRFQPVEGAEAATTVRWGMVTSAKIEIVDEHNALLTIGDKAMRFSVDTAAETRLQIYSTDPPAEYDQPNPGTSMLGFEVSLEPGSQATVRVELNRAVGAR